jgi:hypothetical protein
LIRYLPIAFLLTMLFACSGPEFPKTNSDPAKNNSKTFNADLNDCLGAYQETLSGSHIKQRISCMNLKGWH